MNCEFPRLLKQRLAAAILLRQPVGLNSSQMYRVWLSLENAVELAEGLIDRGAIPKGSEEDALHIAIAATQGVEYVLTWNFRHINNAETKQQIARILESFGYTCPQLFSPEELGGNSND